MSNEIDWIFNVMAFGTYVANENAYLWNEFANKIVL